MDNYISVIENNRLYVTAKEGYVVCLNDGIGGYEIVTSQNNANLIECITIEENKRRIEEQERLQKEQEERMKALNEQLEEAQQ